MRPSTSMQAQLRPISPSPPRKTTRTGLRFVRAQPSGATVTAGGPTAARTFAAWASSSGVDAPMGRRHWPTRRPSARRMALVGSGFGYSAEDSKSKESSSSAFAGDGGGQVAREEGVDHRGGTAGPPSGRRR